MCIRISLMLNQLLPLLFGQQSYLDASNSLFQTWFVSPFLLKNDKNYFINYVVMNKDMKKPNFRGV